VAAGEQSAPIQFRIDEYRWTMCGFDSENLGLCISQLQ
jgi:hypothetical protein